MSINVNKLIDIILGKSERDPVVEFHETEVDLEGVARDIEVEVTVGHHSDTVYITHEIDGEEDLTVSLPVSHVVRSVVDEDCTIEVLGGLLEALDGDDISLLEVVHAIASARMTDSENETLVQRRWERVHTAVLCSDEEILALTDREKADIERDEKVIRTIEVEVPVTEEPLLDAFDRLISGRTPHTLGCLTRGTRFWITSQSLHALHYDERVPATTWGEHLTDDTEVWIEELAPAPETDDTEKSLYSASSVRDLVGMILADNERRPLMIGLLVEAGYAIGKKVS